MDRVERYEIMYIKLIYIISAVGILYLILSYLNTNIIFHNEIFINKKSIIFFTAELLINIIKTVIIKKELFVSKTIYTIVRIVEIFIMALLLSFTGTNILVLFVCLMLILLTSLAYGNSLGLYLAIFFSLVHFISNALVGTVSFYNYIQISLNELYIFYYFALAVFAILFGMVNKDSKHTEQQNKKLLKEIREKYQQLAAAQQEVEHHYSKLKGTNLKLEETNRKLNQSIGEFYTLQQISQAISSIFNISELLRYVNDIIIGVMGVNYSTVCIYDENINMLKVYTTNINDPNEVDLLNNNINCGILMETLSTGKPLLNNSTDEIDYKFTRNRNINSLICVPLMTKTRKLGLILVEQKYSNAFDNENVRLLDVIAQQVSIALENAELYQKMEDLASIDGLTGVYNRLYLQQVLTRELENAKHNGYYVSIAIFDVDNFKIFNDTYGHIFGDKVIRSIADIIKGSIRSTDIIARYGGEEFLIIFPKTNLEDACKKIEFLRNKIEKTIISDGNISASITASFGLSNFPLTALNEIDLLRKADQALYKAKASGRNCVKIAVREAELA